MREEGEKGEGNSNLFSLTSKKIVARSKIAKKDGYSND